MSDLRIPLDYEEKQLPRAVWNLSEPVITTMMQCLNVPLKAEILKPKDDFDFDYEYVLQSMPMVGQLINNYKLRIMAFKSDLSNYYGWMDNNSKISSADLRAKRHHYVMPGCFVGGSLSTYDSAIRQFLQIDRVMSTKEVQLSRLFTSVVPSPSYIYSVIPSFDSHYENLQKYANQSDTVFDMIGLPRSFFSVRNWYDSSILVRGGYRSPEYDVRDTFNADFILTYLDSVRNYLVNNQWRKLPYLYRIPQYDTQADDYTSIMRPLIGEIDLMELDNFFIALRACKNGSNIAEVAFDNNCLTVLLWLWSLKFGGMFLAQYERDMLTTLLYDASYDDVLIQVDDNGNFSINQLRFANRSQLKTDRENIAGGRYRDRLRTVWGSKTAKNMDIPDLVSVNSYVINPRQVVSTADTFNPDTGAGNSSGQLNGVVNNDADAKFKFTIYSEQDSIVMFMAQLVPDVVYCNGLGKGLDVHMFEDEYTPQFDQLGFQDVPRYKYNCLPSYVFDDQLDAKVVFDDTSLTNVVGKNIAFIDMISNIGRVHGKFGFDEYFETWVLKRTFDEDVLADVDGNLVPIGTPVQYISPYANPLKYQYPFTVTSVTDPNFVLCFGLSVRAVRSKGKSFMPTLGN